ncbi:hypothetical protein EV207_108127 [Scopulibacillus darangshiensis]|uniref:DUF3784 domain-containing protein n=1 Tax=Scopulibacillus darangshiensis TaxID=442528 RepID=A0A4R2P4Z2_9BACL|nr:hypothetical protein [Scopulibacillus darangshiensis]TCP29833.1 hypothetical protein EV207_108127 [Scopulibacillus darangshiensis]
MATVPIIICIIIGLLLITAGIGLWKKRRVQVTGQSGGNSVQNKKASAKTIALITFCAGILTLAAPLLTFLIGTDYWVLYILFLVLGGLFIVIGQND